MAAPYKPYQKDMPHSYTFGVFPTLELMACRSAQVRKVLVHSKAGENEGVGKLEDACRKLGVELAVSDSQIERISKREDCLAIGVFDKYESKLAPDAPHVVLVNPSDMGNLGTIVRTVLGFGIANIGIVRPGVDVFHPKAIRASMGAMFRINLEYFDDFVQYKAVHQHNHHVYPFMLNPKATPLPQVKVDKERPFTLVFGNEGAGLASEFVAHGTSVIIPHSEAIDSLNLSVAVGIACYHFAGR